MCGILAAVNFRIEAAVFRQALDLLAHRGPDAQGLWSSADGQVRLGHRRLAIVDLSEAANQPLANEDGALQLVCNGEMYNAPVLRDRLEALGHRFRSHSDNEVVLHAYEEWGDACLAQLEGMFAFVLWDGNQRRLWAARDRTGIKPLYYTVAGNGLALASDLRGLLELLPERPAPEPFALAYHLCLGYVPSPWSIWRGVSKLEPGQALTWSEKDGLRLGRYWEPPRHTEPAAEAPGRWDALFTTTLQDHLLADVPIGLFLSGGLDSSAVAAGLRDLGQPLKTFTVAFPDSPFDEAAAAAAVVAHLGFAGRVVPLSQVDIADLLAKVAAIFDEPQGYSALLPMTQLCAAADPEFRVLLAGDGGDEAFGGYGWYRDLAPPSCGYRLGARRWLKSLASRGGSAAATRWAMASFARQSLLHRHAMRLYPRFLPEEAEALLAPMAIAFGEEELLEPLRRHFLPQLPLRRALQRVDLMTFCSDSVLAKVDRSSMAHSLEVRVPFLDRRIVEWALTLPVSAQEEREGKLVLRDYLRPRIPAAILDRPKQGFSLRGMENYDWQGALEEIGSGYWTRAGLWSRRWRNFVAPGMPYREARIWNLLALTRWAAIWMPQR